jgi:tetratricopeptide (TPR) repeat protein
VRLDPNNRQARAARAAALLACGRAREALAEAERALALEPDDLLAIHARLRSLRALGRHGEADRKVRVRVRKAPSDERAKRAGKH